MDGKEYCNKRVMLGKYRYLMAMVARRGKEAARWNDLAARPVGSGIGSARTRSGAQPVDIGAAKVNALAIEQECDELAEEARRERDRLAICIALVPDADSRDILELAYLNGYTMSQLERHYDTSKKTVNRRMKRAILLLDANSTFFRNAGS